MSDPTKELIFQSDVIARMAASGWKRGAVGDYDRDRALYPAIILNGSPLFTGRWRAPASLRSAAITLCSRRGRRFRKVTSRPFTSGSRTRSHGRRSR